VKIGYVTAKFPFWPGEQFFEPEVRSLARLAQVVVIPIRAPSGASYYPGLGATALPGAMFDRRVAAAALAECLRNPAGVALALAAIVFGRASLRSRVVNLAVFPKALQVAFETRRLGLDHLHAQWLTSPATVAYVASRLTGVPFSVSAHSHDLFAENLVVAKAAHAEFVRLVSKRNRADIAARLPQELVAKCHVVHLGVDVPQTIAEPPPRVPRLLCPARLDRVKGHADLLEAFTILRARGVDFRSEFAGDGELRDEIARRIAQLGLGGVVRMLGNVEHGKLLGALGRGDYDLAVLASHEEGDQHEGIPVALMEAMAAGVPVVATRTGSIDELVDTDSGILVEQRAPQALAAALERLVRDRGLRRRLGLNARARIVAEFASGGTTRQLARLIRADGARTEGPEPRRVRGGRWTQGTGRYGASADNPVRVFSKSISRLMEVTRALRKFASFFAFVLAVSIMTAGAMADSVSPDYRIRVGDTLSVTVFGEEKLSQPSLRVLPGGNISMPLVGDVLVGGRTPTQASAAVARSLARYLRSPKVTIAIVIPATVDVLVLGNVKVPGKYPLQPQSRLTDAIAAAGGLGLTDGPLPNARLQTIDGHVNEVSLQKLFQEGDVSLNYPVENQMTIYVISPLPITVQVWGAVDHPGDVNIKEGDHLVQAIARAGPSVNANSDLNKVELRRTMPDGSIRVSTVNLYDVLKSGNASRDPVLQKGDVVYVPMAKKKPDLLSPLTTLLFLLPRL